jgi:adenosylcobyric acid synthase
MREEAFNRLANHVKQYVKIDVIEKKMVEFQQRGTKQR